MPGGQEGEELPDTPRLLLHRQSRSTLTALRGEEPVRVSRLRGPHRPTQEADELNVDRSPAMVLSQIPAPTHASRY